MVISKIIEKKLIRSTGAKKSTRSPFELPKAVSFSGNLKKKQKMEKRALRLKNSALNTRTSRSEILVTYGNVHRNQLVRWFKKQYSIIFSNFRLLGRRLFTSDRTSKVRAYHAETSGSPPISRTSALSLGKRNIARI